jgi:hypothetical protein
MIFRPHILASVVIGGLLEVLGSLGGFCFPIVFGFIL